MVKSKGKIFIADTDQKSVVLIKDALKAQGYSISSAINGAKALETIIEQLPDIIILGMQLPIIDTEKLRDIISVNPKTDNLALIFMGTPEQLRSVSAMGEKFITNESGSKQFSVFHTSDPIIVEELVAVLQEKYFLQRQI